ncbi:hypothetical protein WT60_24165 [Burkholderia sp. MSMB617WGS]|nr:hypothetical protein WT60_24165 [Burkholderia sp. MSMB617WGS]KVK83427.1 hypothetical protein WS91_06870 [Burkholderia sp. MSMB1498]
MSWGAAYRASPPFVNGRACAAIAVAQHGHGNSRRLPAAPAGRSRGCRRKTPNDDTVTRRNTRSRLERRV